MRKAKLKSRPLTVEMPTGERCDNCFGSGAVRGAVSSYPCGECGGSGLISVDQDYFVDNEDVLASMCIALKRENRELRESLNLGPQRVGSKID
mgnify:CR=1 FL=1